MIALLFDAVTGSLKRAPLLAGLIVLLIALGLGLTAPMLTLYHHLTSDPAGEQSGRLFFVQLDNWRKEEAYLRPDILPPAITWRDMQALRSSDIPSRQAPMFLTSATVGFAADESTRRPIRIDARMTGRDFFSMFQTPMLHGAAWSQEDERSRRQVAVISKALSLRVFGAENGVGRALRVNGREFSVVGVIDDWQLTPRFYDMNDPFGSVEHLYLPFDVMFSAGIWPTFWRTPYPPQQPLTAETYEAVFTNSEIIFVQYWVQLDTDGKREEYAHFLKRHIESQQALGRFPRPANARLSSVRQWVDEGIERSGRGAGVLSLLLVTLLFFAVCLINVVSLLLTKFLRFRSRVAVLRALGCSRRFVFAQHLTEVTTLSVLGGALGLGVSRMALDGAAALFRNDVAPSVNDMLSASSYAQWWALDTSMLLTVFLMALAGGVIAGVYPAWRICELPPAGSLNSL